MSARGCGVTGCPRPHHGRGWCRAHGERVRRTGVPGPVLPERAVLSYRAALGRVRAARGPAAGRPCDGCGDPAALWSYPGGDPAERRDPRHGHRYSLDVTRYRPRCRSCHRRTTGPGGAGRLDVERAAWLYERGASASGIAHQLNASPTAVLRALRAHGVPIRPAGRPPRTTTPPVSEQPQRPDEQQQEQNPHPCITILWCPARALADPRGNDLARLGEHPC